MSEEETQVLLQQLLRQNKKVLEVLVQIEQNTRGQKPMAG